MEAAFNPPNIAHPPTLPPHSFDIVIYDAYRPASASCEIKVRLNVSADDDNDDVITITLFHLFARSKVVPALSKTAISPVCLVKDRRC